MLHRWIQVCYSAKITQIRNKLHNDITMEQNFDKRIGYELIWNATKGTDLYQVIDFPD